MTRVGTPEERGKIASRPHDDDDDDDDQAWDRVFEGWRGIYEVTGEGPLKGGGSERHTVWQRRDGAQQRKLPPTKSGRRTSVPQLVRSLGLSVSQVRASTAYAVVGKRRGALRKWWARVRASVCNPKDSCGLQSRRGAKQRVNMWIRIPLILSLVTAGVVFAEPGGVRRREYGERHLYRRVRYTCPPNFLRLGNSCYFFSAEKASWHDAHFACRDRDSRLISLESKWEDKTLRNYLNRPELERIDRWIGGIYNWSTSRWMWGATGEIMSYLGFLTAYPPRSHRWHCVYMAPSLYYRWNHALCTKPMHYICEAHQTRVMDSNDLLYPY